MQHASPQRTAPPAPAKRRAAVLIALFALLVGCGSDDGAQNSYAPEFTDSNSTNNDTPAPTGDAGYHHGDAGNSADTAGDFDASTVGDASQTPPLDSTYDPNLEPIEGTPTACPTDRVGPDAPGPPGARVFVMSHRLAFDALTSHQSFRARIHRMMHEQIAPCMPAQAPSLVVFPEAMSLPMLLIGPKAQPARQMQDANRALSAMIDAVPDAYAFYGEAYPNTSTNARFMLAMTDPLVRATYDTFGQLADFYDLHISVTVTLPAFTRVTDPVDVERLADPDIRAPQYAYKADGPKLYSRQLLFGPDGELIDESLKNYLSPMGRAQLGLSDAGLSAVHTFESPWGPSAVAISESALMPDVQDRLDDLGARVLLQPNALPGGWTASQAQETDSDHSDAEPATQPPVWQPDRFMLGAYQLVQRSPRVAQSYTPQLTGEFFEILFDAQVQMVADADTSAQSAAFVGQRAPAAGNLFVGPWVVADPISAHPDWTLDQRRDQLRETGQRLNPDAADPLEGAAVEGVWSHDIPAAPEAAASVETHPAILATAERIYLATSHGQIGERGLRLQAFAPDAIGSDSPDSPLVEASVSVPGYDLIRPTIAADETRLHIVAELVGADENRLAYFAYSTLTQAFVGAPQIIDPQLVGLRAYHPAIRVRGAALNMTWVQDIDGVNRAIFAQTSLIAPFEQVSVRTEIARRAEELRSNSGYQADAADAAPASQWDARLAVTSNAIVVTWMNYNAPNWEILAATSVDGGLSWSAPTRVDTVPEGVEALNASPTIEAIDRRRFAIAWTDARATRATTQVAVALLSVANSGSISVTAATYVPEPIFEDEHDATAPPSWAWRPRIVPHGDELSIFYEALHGTDRSIRRARLDTQGTPHSVESVAPAGYFAAAAVTDDGVAIAYETLAPADIGGSTTHLIRRSGD